MREHVRDGTAHEPVDEVKRISRLIKDFGLLEAKLVGEPQFIDDLAQTSATSLERQVAMYPKGFFEQVADGAEFYEYRSSRRLGGVGGKNRSNVKTLDCFVDLGVLNAPFGECFFDQCGDARQRTFLCVTCVTALSSSMGLLGDVG